MVTVNQLGSFLETGGLYLQWLLLSRLYLCFGVWIMFHVFCNQDVADVPASDLWEQLSISPSARLQVRSRIAAGPSDLLS